MHACKVFVQTPYNISMCSCHFLRQSYVISTLLSVESGICSLTFIKKIHKSVEAYATFDVFKHIFMLILCIPLKTAVATV